MSIKELEAYLWRIRKTSGDRLSFVVLFGSHARGNWMPESDYDMLIGLDLDQAPRFIDRLDEFNGAGTLPVEPFPYTRPELDRMFESHHPLLLEALEDGVILFDRGSFARMRSTFQEWKREGRLEKVHNGWRIRE